jgi:magnesium chelatase family protein
MNPCPCGYFGSTRECKCSPMQIQRYVGKISGPLMDRIDIHVDVPAVKFNDLRGRGTPEGETSAAIRERVNTARSRQLELGSTARVSFRMRQCRPGRYANSARSMRRASRCWKKRCCARAFRHERTTGYLKVARTIADLEGSDQIQPAHLSEAINYRSLDRNYWM